MKRAWNTPFTDCLWTTMVFSGSSRLTKDASVILLDLVLGSTRIHWWFREFMYWNGLKCREFRYSLVFLGITRIHWRSQWIHVFAENFREYVNSLITRIPGNIYTRVSHFKTFLDFRPRVVKKLCFYMRKSRMQNLSSLS